MLIALGRGFAAVGEDLVGTALWWPYGPTHGTVGMVIVSPACQGRGIGRRLMLNILNEAEGRILALNATQAGVKLYSDLGFVQRGGVRQFQGVVAGRVSGPDPTQRIAVLAEEIVAFDRLASGMDRRGLFAALLREGEGYMLRRADVLEGFAFRRRFGRGLSVGPVAALSPESASTLVRRLVADVDGFIRLDVIDGWPALNAELLELGLSDAGTVSTMARGERDRHRSAPFVFALASQALG